MTTASLPSFHIEKPTLQSAGRGVADFLIFGAGLFAITKVIGFMMMVSASTDLTTEVSPAVERDNAFLAKASQNSTFAVYLAQLGAEKSSRPEVRELGRQMLQDRVRIDGELRKMLVANGITVSQALNEENERKIEKISSLTGEDFDRAFLAMTLQGNQRDVAVYKLQRTSTHDARLQAALNNMIPLVSAHLDKVNRILASNANQEVPEAPKSPSLALR